MPLTTGGSIGLAFYNIATRQQAGLSPGSDHNRDDGVTIVHFAATGGREYYVKVNVYDQYNGSKSTKYHGKYHLVLTDITGVTLLTNNMIFDAGDNATVRDKTVGTTSWGISFIAGTHSAWYKIDRLQLFIEDTNSNATPVVTIRATSGERPGDALCTFVGLNGYASGIRAADEDVPDILYPDPDNCDDLEADYRYWVVMEAQDTTKSYKVGTLVVTASVTGPAADWIISGTVMEKDNSTTTPAWSRVRPDQHILFRLWGTPKTSSAATAVDPPTVSGAPAVSEAGSDGEWTPDETVEVTFTFSEAVTVDATGGTPTVGISLGGSAARSAAYLRGSGTTELTFGYTLTDADGSHSSMIVTHNSLALNGGTIRSQAASVDADLSHAGKAVTGPRSQNSVPKGADKQPANTPATGLPTITGTVQVGQVLTADTSAIADTDGLTLATFAHQWIAGTADISGATGSSHTLTSGDQGRSIRVKVTFTDDAGNSEELISAATFAVAPPPLTATIHDASDSHDGQTAFTFRLRLSEEFGISYRTLRDHAFTVTGGEVVKASRLEQGSNISWEITVQPDGDEAITIVLPVTTDCDATGAICTPDGRVLSNSSTITVPGPATQSQPAQVENSPATGLPTITGTLQVDEDAHGRHLGHRRPGRLVRRFLRLPVDSRRVEHLRGHRLQLHPHVQPAGPDHQGQGHFYRRPGTPGDTHQRCYRISRCCAISPDGLHRRCARVPRRPDGIHLRAALQRGVFNQLQDPAGPRVHGDGGRGDQGKAAGEGQERPLGDTRPAGLCQRRDHRAAGNHGLRCAGSSLHGGQEVVQQAGDDRQRAVTPGTKRYVRKRP